MLDFVFELVSALVGVVAEVWFDLTVHAWADLIHAPSARGLAFAAALSSPPTAVLAAIGAWWWLA